VCACRGGGRGEVSSGLKYARKAGGTVSTMPLPPHYYYYYYCHYHSYHYLVVYTLLLSAPPTPADVRERTRVCASPAVRARLFKYSAYTARRPALPLRLLAAPYSPAPECLCFCHHFGPPPPPLGDTPSTNRRFLILLRACTYLYIYIYIYIYV
jgi:hypothetical protein